MWRRGQAFAVDLLGEATVTEVEAEAYFERCEETLRRVVEVTRGWPDQPLLDADPHGPLPRANLSIKLTALTPLLRPLAPERGAADAARRLRPLLRLARDLGAHIHLDMEDYDSRETLLLAFEELLADEEFRGGPSVGVVVQAYLRDADETLERILALPALGGREVPPTIRLVKGAYWDHERVIAAQRGWEAPVWAEKRHSDACFERLSHALIDARDRVRPAIATHNLRSLAQAMAYLERAGGRPEELELQVLRGLGDELADGRRRLGYRVRVYTPIGDLVAGMAYLVRRLLENSSSQGFLLRSATIQSTRCWSARAEANDHDGWFRNHPLLELRRPEVREELTAALAGLDAELPLQPEMVVGGKRPPRRRGECLTDPCAPERVVARLRWAGVDAAERALDLALALRLAGAPARGARGAARARGRARRPASPPRGRAGGPRGRQALGGR